MDNRSGMCSSLYQRLNSSSCSAGTSTYTINSPCLFLAAKYHLPVLRSVVSPSLSLAMCCHNNVTGLGSLPENTIAPISGCRSRAASAQTTVPEYFPKDTNHTLRTNRRQRWARESGRLFRPGIPHPRNGVHTR
ncbi:hypothetical protein GBAR_LOCUS13630 [Geodia barretti]|uniref:Uncharacterized protein n=1 Tax=Geodia barretti TaxID=519541 RepID=A0AA35S514_GEOBA|nr:hypothetical protein GBAR_LOCUS13630 [Geodia barretti]